MKVRQQTRFVYRINLILPHHTQKVKAESLLRTKWAQTRLLNPSMKMIPSPRAMIFILRVIPPSNAVANPNTFAHYSAATSAQQIWPRAQHHGGGLLLATWCPFVFLKNSPCRNRFSSTISCCWRGDDDEVAGLMVANGSNDHHRGGTPLFLLDYTRKSKKQPNALSVRVALEERSCSLGGLRCFRNLREMMFVVESTWGSFVWFCPFSFGWHCMGKSYELGRPAVVKLASFFFSFVWVTLFLQTFHKWQFGEGKYAYQIAKKWFDLWTTDIYVNGLMVSWQD